MKHIGTSVFETERLLCRRFEEKDLDDMFVNWASDPMVQLEYGEPVYSTKDETGELLKAYMNSYSSLDIYRFAIIEKISGKNIGQIALCKVYSDSAIGEIEYCIGQKFWGKGYAGEALDGLIKYLFSNSEFIWLEAYHRIENDKSGKVLKKSSMHITDNVERFRRLGEEPVGEICYCIEKQ